MVKWNNLLTNDYHFSLENY